MMRHRGPDGEGFFIDGSAGIGICCLALSVQRTADQPVFSEDGLISVICDGQIYNSAELRKELMAAGHHFRGDSAVEVIVHLYEDLGIDCVRRLRGMFGFAVWDSRLRQLMLARDRLGIKPLYYSIGKDACCFASEIKPILILQDQRQRPDFSALRDLFTFGFPLSSRTLFSGIQKLPPGHILLAQNGAARIKPYWQITFPPRAAPSQVRSSVEWAEALFEKVRESARIHLSRDIAPVSWLSGGIDSSTIAALISRLTGEPLRTFSLTFGQDDLDEFSGQKTLDCYPEYRLINHKIRCSGKDFELFPKSVWHSESITATTGGILYMLLARSTAPDARVTITGEGADEIFGGYGWYHMDKLLRPWAKLPLPLRNMMLLGPLIPRLWPGAARTHLAPREMNLARYQSLLSPRRLESMEEVFSEDLKHEIRRAPDAESSMTLPPDFDEWEAFAQLQYFDLTQRLPNLIAHLLDSSAMAHTVETRVPFLDHELVEFCSTIPVCLKMKGFQEKHILRKAVRKLLPDPIVRRKKKGLQAPYGQWLREKLPDFAEEMLSQKILGEKGYFDPAGVANLLNKHRAGKVDVGMQLLAILAIQLWDELFMKNPKY